MAYNYLNEAEYIRNSQLCFYDSRTAYEIKWEENGDVEGWDTYSLIHTYGVWDGVLFGTSYGGDYYIGRSAFFAPVEGETYYIINIQMKVVSGRRDDQVTEGKIQWLRDGDAIWDDDKSTTFDVTADDKWRLYTINMGPEQWWQGDIRNLRIYPLLGSRTGDRFFIRSVTITSPTEHKCTNTTCSYYPFYEHPCPGVGERGSCLSESITSAVTVVEDVNDELIVNIDDYGDQTLKVQPRSAYSVTEIAKAIEKELTKIDIGGYVTASVVRDADRLRIYSGTFASDSSVVVKYSQLADDLNFYDGMADISIKATGEDSATGYEPAATYRLRGVDIQKLINGDTEEIAFYHDPSRYEIEAGRVDWQEKTKAGFPIDIETEGITIFDGEGQTVIDFTHPFNSDGRVTKVKVMGYPKDGETSKLKIFRPKMDGTLKLVEDITFGADVSGNVYSTIRDTYVIDVDFRARKGDLVGFYNMNLYIGDVLSDLPDAMIYYLQGDAIGTFNPGELKAYGPYGLNFYAHGDRRQDLVLLEIDLGHRVNAKSLLFYGEEETEDFEYNIAICEDVGWNVNLFGGSHTHYVNDTLSPENSYTATHENRAYGVSKLSDGITHTEDAIAGTSYGFESSHGFYTDNSTYFYVNGDAEWLNLDPGEFSDDRYVAEPPPNFNHDPIQFTLTFAEPHDISRTVVYFKNPKNFHSFGWAYYLGDYQYVGNFTPNSLYQWVPEYAAVSLDNVRMTYDSAPDEETRDYLFSNPNDPSFRTGEYDVSAGIHYLDPNSQIAGFSLAWNVLTHEFNNLNTKSIAFYTDWHSDTSIMEIEVYSSTANESSLLDDVLVTYSREGTRYDTSVFEDIIINAEAVASALIQDNPRYINLELRSSAPIKYKEFFLLLEEDSVRMGPNKCLDSLQIETSRRGADNPSQYVDVWNEFEVPANLYVDIPTEDISEGVILWSKLDSAEDVTNPDIGPGGYYYKNSDVELKNDDYQVAINDQCWALANLADQKTFYYQYHDFGWLEWGLYSIGDNIEVAHPNKRSTRFSFTPTSATYFKFVPKNFALYGVSEMLVSYDGDDVEFTGYREGNIIPSFPLSTSEETLTDTNPTTGNFNIGDNYTNIDSFSGSSIDTDRWRISNGQYLEVDGGELKTKFTAANQECYVDSYGKWMLPYDRLWRCWINFEMDDFVAPTGSDHTFIRLIAYNVQNSSYYMYIDRRINDSEDRLSMFYSASNGSGGSYVDAVTDGFDSDFTDLQFRAYHYTDSAMQMRFFTPTYDHYWDQNRWSSENVGWWFRIYFKTSAQAVTIPTFRISLVYEEMPDSEGVLGASFGAHTALDSVRVLHNNVVDESGPVVYQSIEGAENEDFFADDEWSVDVYVSYDNITYGFWDTAQLVEDNFNDEINTYVTADLGQRRALEYIRTYGPSATDYAIESNTLYYNDSVTDVDLIDPESSETGSINDVRWPVVIIPEGEAMGRVGIYPNPEYSLAPGGGYNCVWEDIGNILTEYSRKENVLLSAAVSASSEFQWFKAGFTNDGLIPDGEIERAWGSLSESTPYLLFEFDDEYDIDELRFYWGYDTTDTQWVVSDYEVWVTTSGTVDDFSGDDGNVPNILKWENVTQAEIENNSLKIWSTTGSNGKAELKTEIAGDFSSFVTYSGAFPNTHDYATSFRAFDPVTSGIVQVGRRYDNFTHFYIMQYYDGTWNTVGSTVTTTDTSGKLKLERIGSVIHGYYWDAGWVELGTSTQLGTVDAKIQLVQERWDFYPEVTSYFDNFYLFTEKIVDTTGNADFNVINSLDDAFTTQYALVQILGYDAGSMFFETGEGAFETFEGATCREIEIYTTRGVYYISSEDYPIVAVDFGYKFNITSHNVTTPFEDYPDSLWDNDNSKFRFSDNLSDNPQKVEFTTYGASLPREAKWILAKDTDFISSGITTYATDFSEYTLYSPPSDWYAHNPPGGYTWEITDALDNPLPASDRVMHVNTGADDYRFVWSDVPLAQDIEVLGLLYAPAGYSGHLVVRGTGSWDLGEQHGFMAYFNGTQIKLERVKDGNYISTTFAFTFSLTTDWYWLRFKLSGSNQYVKGWAYGDTEPGSWTGTTNYSDLNQSGWAGVMNYGFSGTSYYFGYFSAGIGGTSAPHPDDAEIDEIEQAVAGGVNFLDSLQAYSSNKYKLTRFPWWWESTYSDLSESATYTRPGSERSVQIAYHGGPTTSGIDEISFVEGTNFGIDDRWSEMDYLSFYLHVPDSTKLADYGEVRFGNLEETRYHIWDISTTVSGFSNGWNQVQLKFREADSKINNSGDDTYSTSYLALNNYEDLELKSFSLKLRGKGDPFIIRLDDLRIERNTFHDTVKFDKGLYLNHNEYVSWPLGEFNPHRGSLEMWMRPDYNFSGVDSFFRARTRTLFIFTNVANDIFGFFVQRGVGLCLITGNTNQMIVERVTPTINTDWLVDDIIHLGFVWSNDGTDLEYGMTAALSINGLFTGFTRTTWEVTDKKSTRLIIGGATPQGPALYDSTSAWASIDNLVVYNYCKRDFLDRGIEEPTFKRVLSPNEFIKISSDNINFYSRDDANLPLYFEQVPADDRRRIWIKTNVPDNLSGAEKRTASLKVEWIKSF